MAGQMPPKGPPYLPQVWTLGGKPEKNVDIPVTAVFLALYAGAAACHMTILQLNQRRGHKFLLSGLMFGFCMARIVTCIMRISSTALPTDVPLAIAAQIFTAAGVVLLFVVNLVFTQRLIRSAHPRWGWNPLVSAFFKFLYALIIVTIAMVIVCVVQQFYTLRADIHRIDRAFIIYGGTCYAIISFLPIPMILATVASPRKDARPLDKFGKGSWRYKTTMLIIGSTLISFGACYRAGTTWLSPVPQTQPLPGVLGKGPFYVANFTVEILTIYLYAISRVDQRFHVPNGAKAHKNYQKAAVANQAGIAEPEPAYTGEKGDMSDEPPNTGISSKDSWSHLRHGDSDGEKSPV